MINLNFKPVYSGKIIKVVSKPCYLLVTELQNFLCENEKSWPITYAVSKSGDYIGTGRDAYRLVHNFGISVFEKRDKSNSVVSIGYSLHRKKWYGWSHRAIFGFKRKRDAARFAESVS